MATTGLVNGTLLKVYVDSTAIAFTTSATLDLSMATREATTKDSAGWSGKLEGLREWSISGDFLFAFDSAYTFDDFFALVKNRTAVTVRFSSNVSGDKRYSGSAYLTSVNLSAGTEETVTGSFTFEGNGVLTESTYPS